MAPRFLFFCAFALAAQASPLAAPHGVTADTFSLDALRAYILAAPQDDPVPKTVSSPKAAGSPKATGARPKPAAKGTGSTGTAKGTGSTGTTKGSSGFLGSLGGLLGGSGSSDASAAGGLGFLGDALGKLTNGNANDITSGAACKPVTLIFARGTGEPGNMGYVVGPGLAQELKKALGGIGGVAVQGLEYSTDFSGKGATTMVNLVKQVAEKCPETKVVLGGYSQGGMVVHQAVGQLGADAGKVAAVATFGDPFGSMGWGKGFDASKAIIACSSADAVCIGSKGTPGVAGSGSHLSYSSDGSITKVVQFIVGKVGGTPAVEGTPAVKGTPA
ncbi:cutinase-domain-containing protein [Trichodelitschia bisporula]|uniref:Cutinase n=1 Tax=Trichodelitschia bisporula TaxID=703511 RepID=A0A6G1HPJ6_9PEZI|nr:cutinase-domain-containing protein [Trichodelitschia bisporula]